MIPLNVFDISFLSINSFVIVFLNHQDAVLQPEILVYFYNIRLVIKRPDVESLIRTWSPLANHCPWYRKRSPAAYISLSVSSRNVLLSPSRNGPVIVFILGDEDEDKAATAMIIQYIASIRSSSISALCNESNVKGLILVVEESISFDNSSLWTFLK
ncbi:13769_t:CDS:2 [Funneliformis caledonium]|uniref:13769_t:CDS:1 n=1 Tax=Funneliformis caledonium TaxID=1117310 RepID=A0A9N8ZU09_9GLOM|nr:13769_t:CDS:2 [Funneliformis caledonium]